MLHLDRMLWRLSPRYRRAALVLLLAAWALLLCWLAYLPPRTAAFTLESLPPGLSLAGFHEPERLPDEAGSFRWTDGRGELTLPNPGGAVLVQMRLSSGDERVVPVLVQSGGQTSRFLVGPGLRNYRLLLHCSPAARIPLTIASPTIAPQQRTLGVVISAVQLWGGGALPLQVPLVLLLAATGAFVLLRQVGWNTARAVGALLLAQALLVGWQAAIGWRTGLLVPGLLLALVCLAAAGLLRWYAARPRTGPRLAVTPAALCGALSGRMLWSVLLFVVVVANVIRMTKDFDDLSVLRASSYMARFADDPLLERLEQHLASNRDALGTWTYHRFQNRYDQVGSYTAQNWLIGLLERLPLASPFQSVFFSTLLLHLAAVVSLFALAGWLFGVEGRVVQLGLLLSVVHITMLMGIFPTQPLLFSPFLAAHRGIVWLMPSPTWDQTWLSPASRAAAMLFFLGALLLWHQAWQQQAKRWRSIVLALLLLLAALLCHHSMTLLFLLPALLIEGGYRLFRLDAATFAERAGWRRVLLLYNLGSLAACAALLVVLLRFFPGKVALFPAQSRMLPASLLLSNALIAGWLILRTSAAFADSRLKRPGDALLGLVLPLTILVASGYVFEPIGAALVDDLYVLVQARNRLSGLVHLLWWLLLTLCLYAAALRWRLRLPRPALTGVLVLLCLLMSAKYEGALARDFDLFRRDLLTTRISPLLERRGIAAYEDDTLFFQAVANELRANHRSVSELP